MNDLINIVGIVGAAIVLFAFLLNQVGKVKNTDLSYDFANFLGSLLLVTYAIAGNAVPFIIVNLVWGGYSFKDIVQTLVLKKKK